MARSKKLVSIPANLIELNERISRYGAFQRSLAATEGAQEAAIAAVKAHYAADIALAAEGIEREEASIRKYAEVHRATLLVSEAKSISFTAGRIGWRKTPWKVSFFKNGAEKALAFLRENTMRDYIREIEEVDKEALLRDRPVVDGLKYKQTDEFFIDANAETQKVEALGEAILVSK